MNTFRKSNSFFKQMNSTLKLLFLASFIVLSSAISGFAQTANVTSGCAPLIVKFTAPAGSSTYYWDFKDGVTSNLQNPTSAFAHPGTYNVEFRESVGGPVIGTIPITIFNDPQININTQIGCAPFDAHFQNLSVVDPAITIQDYIWVFDDGQSSDGIENPTHTYSTIGKYDVSFNIQTNYPTCNKTVIFTDAVEVVDQPVSNFTTNPPLPPSTCQDQLTVNFTNTSTGSKPMNYLWKLGNGVTSTATNPPAQTYTDGQYTATLLVTYPSIPGCASINATPISVGSPKPNIIIPTDTMCINISKPFTTHTIGRYLWDFGPNAVVDTTLNSDSLDVYFTQAGTQTVSLTVTSLDGQCSTTKTVQIYVDQVTANITSAPTYSCKSPYHVQFNGTSNQSNVTYRWIFSNGDTISNVKTVNETFYSATDSIYYSTNDYENVHGALIVTSKITGCQGFAGEDDTLWLPNARFQPDLTKGCAPLSVVFSDSSSFSLFAFSHSKNISRTWIFGDGSTQTVTDSLPVTHVYTTPGSYMARLVVNTSRGCSDTSYAVLIEVGSNLASQIDFVADKSSVCPGETVNFTAQVSPSAAALIDGYHFSSEDNRVFHCSDQTSVPWSYNYSAGPQDVSLTVDYNGCFTTVTKPGFVTVKGAIAKIDYAASCDQPLDYHFKNQSMNAVSSVWNFGDGQTATSTAANLLHTYAYAPNVSPFNDYTVTLTASDPASGCAATVDTKTVHVRKLNSKITSDTLLCAYVGYSFDASQSTDVYANCYTGYTWQFKGIDKRPNTSANASSAFSFPSSGKYTVLLITHDINGCVDTAQTKVRVYDTHPNWTTDKPSVCIPNTVQFTNTTTSDTTIVSWNWSFGDSSNTTSTLKNPSVSFTTKPNPDTLAYYVVNLFVKDKLGCTNVQTIQLPYYKPVSSIVASDYALCLGDSVTLSAPDFTSAGSHLSYTWDLGNGTTSTAPVNHILYSTAQLYHVKLKYTEAGSSCKDSSTLDLDVQAYPTSRIKTNVDSLSVLCAPQNVFFRDSSASTSLITSYYWDFGNTQTSNAKTFALFYPKGHFTATHIVQTSNGCADTSYKNFSVQRPVGTFTAAPTSICKGDEVTFAFTIPSDTADIGSYTWAFGDGTTLDNVAPVVHKYNFHPVSGQAPARLIIRGADSICPIELQQVINIQQVIADFDRGINGDTSICFSQGSFPFVNKSVAADSYSWNFGDNTFSTTENPSHLYAVPGNYNVTLSISNIATGCVDTISKSAIVYANPVTVATGDTVCQGSPIQLQIRNPVSNSHYQWSPSTGLTPTDTSTSPVATLAHSIVYDLVETDVNGCSDAIKVPAIVIEPIPLSNYDTTIVIGDMVTLPVYNPYNVYHFSWTPTTGLSCVTCNFPTVKPLKDITYSLEVTDIRNCFDNTYLLKITVKPDTFVKLPTMFTPNGDGNNDFLYVEGWGIKQLLDFSIFNRWGQQIYSSNDITEGWNGTFNGILQNSDVYVYKVKVLTWRNEEVHEEGHVNLMH
jgi:gliding motility-associated-like protein